MSVAVTSAHVCVCQRWCLCLQEFQKQTLVDALLRLGGAEEVEAAQRKADQLIEAYCDQGFA